MATMMKNGKCLVSIRPAGQFDLALLDLAGRTVYHTIAMGPKSLTLARGAIRNGAYVARLIWDGQKSEEKILISR